MNKIVIIFLMACANLLDAAQYIRPTKEIGESISEKCENKIRGVTNDLKRVWHSWTKVLNDPVSIEMVKCIYSGFGWASNDNKVNIDAVATDMKKYNSGFPEDINGFLQTCSFTSDNTAANSLNLCFFNNAKKFGGAYLRTFDGKDLRDPSTLLAPATTF
uniref:Putative secreted protein n=1 Tax=Corethrella appendiculata TaxID=1370023 RepID=U5ENH8_9DIPT